MKWQWGGEENSLVGQPLPCGIQCFPWIESVRIEFNYRIPPGVAENWFVWGKISIHLFTKVSEVFSAKVKETCMEETYSMEGANFSLQRVEKSSFLKGK